MESLEELISKFEHHVGGPIVALRAVMAREGFIDDQAQAAVAGVFNLSRAEVRGIVSF